MAIGAGYMADSRTIEGGSFPGKVDARGGAITLEIAVGGSLSPGFILAGSYTLHGLNNANLANDSRTNRVARDPNLSLLAAMVDVYPNPRGGFHVGGGLGLASLQARGDQTAGGEDQNGWGFAPHVGYEWWVSSYWGIGVLGRFIYARTKGDYAGGTATDATTAGAVSFSATYN